MTRADRSRLSFFLDAGNWPLFYHTAKNMQARQLAGVLERKARHAVLPALPVDFDARYERRVPADPGVTPGPVRADTADLRRCLPAERAERYRRRLDETGDGTLTFLNASVDVADGDGPDWFHPALDDRPGLWALKFHGFEFLSWPVLTGAPADLPDEHRRFTRWIRAWDAAETTRIGAESYLRRAWTPHAVSLRLLYWCRYYAWCERSEDDDAFLRTLRRLVYKNALFLARHVEHDVGGNHLVENGVALVMAGVMCDDGADWLDAGLDVMAGASDQFLADGGHFERSPMYHAIVLTRYLTALNLLRAAGRSPPAGLERVAERATGFLESIRPPDGRIPLLNDAVFGEALPLDACLAYARSAGVTSPGGFPRDRLEGSGYYWLGDGDDRLLVDGGAFGPPHLPAHSHNDLFSVLLWVDGTRLLTDTGTYEYAPTPRRQRARSVRGHNTAQVGSAEPVDIGGRYLAGRRVHPRVSFDRTGDRTVFDGTYRKRGVAGKGYTHRRRVVAGDGWWLLGDRLGGNGERPVRSRFHLHPDVTVETRGGDESALALSVDGSERAHLLAAGATDVTQTSSPYYPAFGTEVSRSAVVLEADADSPAVDVLLSKRPHSREAYRQIVASVDGEESPDLAGPRPRST